MLIFGMLFLIILFSMLRLGMWGAGFTMLFFKMECIGRGGLLGLVFIFVFIFIFIIKIFAVGTVGMGVLGCLAKYSCIVRAREEVVDGEG